MTKTMGLRERKRNETRARIETAAVSLVLSRGLENTTVEDISELADVSPRTFFNYFDSKDNAILGVGPEVGDQEFADVVTLPADTSLVAYVVGLLFTSLGGAETAVALREHRAEIFRRHPHLLGEKMTKMTTVVGQLTSSVQAQLARDARFADLDAAALLGHAELLTATCSAAVRVSVRQRITSGDEADEAHLRSRAIELVEQLLERLQ